MDPYISDLEHVGNTLLVVFWQGVTLTDLKEAEKTVARTTEPPARSIQPVSPIITVTPAQRGKFWSRAGRWIRTPSHLPILSHRTNTHTQTRTYSTLE